MPTLARTLDVARSQLGVLEPATNQITKYGVWYATWSGQGGYKDTYWCAMFQSWVLMSAGFSVAEAGRYGNCNPWIRWLRTKGMWSASPTPGSLVFFDWDHDGFAEHVGMVESVRPDGRLVTIEGNASVAGRRDGVYRMVRGRGSVMGFGRLRYAPLPIPPKPKPKPGPAKKPPPQVTASTRMPGPVVVTPGLGRAPGTVDARHKKWQECPQMPVGFGGPEDRAQRIWAAYWFALMARWSPGYFRQITATGPGRREVERHEIGPITVKVAEVMLRSVQKTNSFRGVIPRNAWSLYQPR